MPKNGTTGLNKSDLQRLFDAARDNVLIATTETPQTVYEAYLQYAEGQGIPAIAATTYATQGATFVLTNPSTAEPALTTEQFTNLNGLLAEYGEVCKVGQYGLGVFVPAASTGELVANLLTLLDALPKEDMDNATISRLLSDIPALNGGQ